MDRVAELTEPVDVPPDRARADLQTPGELTARPVAVGLRPNLVAFRDANGRELFDLPDAPRPDPGTPAPPRFFPEYDNVSISHADRSRMAPEEFRGKMGAAWLATEQRNLVPGANAPENVPLSWSMFSVDGFLSGTWKTQLRDGRTSLVLQPMVRISDDEAEELQRRAGACWPS